MNKRILKRKKLVKKLFNRILIDNNVDIDLQKIIELGFRDNVGASQCRCFSNHYTQELTKVKIVIDLKSIVKRIKQGYSDKYYEGRKNKLNPLILNNRKRHIRFVLLHELKHAIDRKEIGYEYVNWNCEKVEKRADDFAIERLK